MDGSNGNNPTSGAISFCTIFKPPDRRIEIDTVSFRYLVAIEEVLRRQKRDGGGWVRGC